MTNPDPFVDLRRALLGEIESQEEAGVRIDRERHARTGAPEVIYGQGKSPDQIVVAARKLIESEDACSLRESMATQLPRSLENSLQSVARSLMTPLAERWSPCVQARCRFRPGDGGILTAGSSDRPQALEAAAVLAEMGCSVSLQLRHGDRRAASAGRTTAGNAGARS
ncbi:MAG: hypothetical protein R2848_06995 [Thermomicrobiales bacterium]